MLGQSLILFSIQSYVFRYRSKQRNSQRSSDSVLPPRRNHLSWWKGLCFFLIFKCIWNDCTYFILLDCRFKCILFKLLILQISTRFMAGWHSFACSLDSRWLTRTGFYELFCSCLDGGNLIEMYELAKVKLN